MTSRAPEAGRAVQAAGSAAVRAPADQAGPGAQRPGQRSRGPLLYYLLAGFDVVTVSASLYLNHRIMRIYTDSVAGNQEWAQRMADYSDLGGLAARVNAPGNDVFVSLDVAGESARMQQALQAFEARLRELRAQLGALAGRAGVTPLLAGMDEIELATREMVAESRQIFAHFEGGQRGPAGESMASMDRRYARVLDALRGLSASVAAVQRRNFEQQTAAAAALQRFEYVIAGLILVMVGAATLYGRRLAQQSARDAEERSHHIAELQSAGDSLRRAHDELETRVRERTRELRESESALRLAAAEWERTFEAIDSPLLIVDGNERVLRLNRAACEQAGRREEELRGAPLAALGPGEPWHSAAEVALGVRGQDSPARVAARDARTGQVWEVAGYRVESPDGHGRERYILVASDVTRLVDLQESVRREERMAAMGELVAGVAHEVRNPLFGISSTLDAFEARHGSAEPFGRYLSVLRSESERLGTLMRDLLEYGRPPGLELSAADFERAVDDAARLCAALAERARVRVEKAAAIDAGSARMDRGRVLQALQNVIQNAIQHSPADAAVRLTFGREARDGRAFVWCSIHDQGSGFREADLPHLFEPFFTRRRGGTGLGLSIAQRIVLQHGGAIEAANHAQGGARITIRLPADGPEERA
jgi:PAS domain S-box-containing protein